MQQYLTFNNAWCKNSTEEKLAKPNTTSGHYCYTSQTLLLVDGPSRTVNPACVQPHIAQASKGLGKRPTEHKPYNKTLLPDNLGTHCREWPAGKANAEVQMLVEANSKPHDIMIYMDGVVTRDRSGWGSHSQSNRVEGLYTSIVKPTVITSSLTMEVEAVTHAI